MRLLLLTVIGCLVFAAADARKPEGQRSPRAQKAERTAPRGAHLKMENPTYDFGEVPRRGGDLVHEFRFVNDGTAPLVLVRVNTSCSCLKASFSKRPVQPADSGVIRIVYQPLKSEPGTFNKVIQIYSNSVDGRDVITVQGHSIEGPPRKVKIRNDKTKIRN